MSSVPRVVGADDLGSISAGQLIDVMNAVAAILAIPRDPGLHVDALVVPTGQGEEWRITDAIRIWERNRQINRFLVANGNPAETTYREITLDYLRRLGLRRLDGVYIQAEPAPHTGLQAAWLDSQVKWSLRTICRGSFLPSSRPLTAAVHASRSSRSRPEVRRP